MFYHVLHGNLNYEPSNFSSVPFLLPLLIVPNIDHQQRPRIPLYRIILLSVVFRSCLYFPDHTGSSSEKETRSDPETPELSASGVRDSGNNQYTRIRNSTRIRSAIVVSKVHLIFFFLSIVDVEHSKAL